MFTPGHRRDVFDPVRRGGEAMAQPFGPGRCGAALVGPIDPVPCAVDHGQRQGGHDVARWPAGDDRMGAGGRDPAGDLPSDAEQLELALPDPLLQLGQQLVLLVPDVLTQHFGEATEQHRTFGAAGRMRLQLGDQFVDLLVLLLDLQSERLAVLKHTADRRPEHRLLGECMREDQPVQVSKYGVLLRCRGTVERVQQLIEPDVITLLPGEHADGSAELGFGLLAEGTHVLRIPTAADPENEPADVAEKSVGEIRSTVVEC